jgi:hypothetical protein
MLPVYSMIHAVPQTCRITTVTNGLALNDNTYNAEVMSIQGNSLSVLCTVMVNIYGEKKRLGWVGINKALSRYLVTTSQSQLPKQNLAKFILFTWKGDSQ